MVVWWLIDIKSRKQGDDTMIGVEACNPDGYSVELDD
jgi:hypothetical protein